MRGTLLHEDIGAGSWVLLTPSGERYTLQGAVPAALANQKVIVLGTIKTGEDAGFGFAMSGDPVISVTSITAA